MRAKRIVSFILSERTVVSVRFCGRHLGYEPAKTAVGTREWRRRRADQHNVLTLIWYRSWCCWNLPASTRLWLSQMKLQMYVKIFGLSCFDAIIWFLAVQVCDALHRTGWPHVSAELPEEHGLRDVREPHPHFRHRLHQSTDEQLAGPSSCAFSPREH